MAGKLTKGTIPLVCLLLLLSYGRASGFMFDVGSFDASSFETKSAGQRSVTLGLNPGWNFISIPTQPKDASINVILKDVSSDVRVVWGHDNQNKQWLKYIPGATGQATLEKISAGSGYWVYMGAPADLTIGGFGEADYVLLFTGWNLVGYSGNDNQVPDASYMTLSGINDQWTILWNWENGEWKAKTADSSGQLSVQPIVSLNRGRAYWIKIRPAAADALQWQQ